MLQKRTEPDEFVVEFGSSWKSITERREISPSLAHCTSFDAPVREHFAPLLPSGEQLWSIFRLKPPQSLFTKFEQVQIENRDAAIREARTHTHRRIVEFTLDPISLGGLERGCKRLRTDSVSNADLNCTQFEIKLKPNQMYARMALSGGFRGDQQ